MMSFTVSMPAKPAFPGGGAPAAAARAEATLVGPCADSLRITLGDGEVPGEF